MFACRETSTVAVYVFVYLYIELNNIRVPVKTVGIFCVSLCSGSENLVVS